ncbi:hypothetical protein [Lepagella muris]|nr:hypothetical protein [Lepagella muris]
MKAKVKRTGEIIEVEKISKGIYGRVGVAEIYKSSMLDFRVKQTQTKQG